MVVYDVTTLGFVPALWEKTVAFAGTCTVMLFIFGVHRSVAALIPGRRVLATGAGGSIASELARQLVLTDKEIWETYPYLEIVTRLVSVRDKTRLRDLFSQCRPDVVFYAAALKHVPLVEDKPIEVIKINVLGTRNVVDVALENGASTFIMISTDKVVNPTNVMDATKRAAEAYLPDDRPVVANDAVQDDPIRQRAWIERLSRSAFSGADRGRWAGHGHASAHRTLFHEIVFSGLRSGEKLYEELFDLSELQGATTKGNYVRRNSRIVDRALLMRTLEGIEAAVLAGDGMCVLEILRHIVPSTGRHVRSERQRVCHRAIEVGVI